MKLNLIRLSIMLGIGGISLFSACMNHTYTKSQSSNDLQVQVKRLLHEADSILRSDSLFWIRTITTRQSHMAQQDKQVREKLDSAILLCPHQKEAYVQKYVYLIACRKTDELLPLLQLMDANCDSLQGDFLSVKGVLEYHQGDSLSGQQSFLRADQFYQTQLDNSLPNDSLLYCANRISKALNLSLMKNDFRILQEELNISRKIYPLMQSGMNSLEKLTNREDFYHLLAPAE